VEYIFGSLKHVRIQTNSKIILAGYIERYIQINKLFVAVLSAKITKIYKLSTSAYKWKNLKRDLANFHGNGR